MRVGWGLLNFIAGDRGVDGDLNSDTDIEVGIGKNDDDEKDDTDMGDNWDTDADDDSDSDAETDDEAVNNPEVFGLWTIFHSRATPKSAM